MVYRFCNRESAKTLLNFLEHVPWTAISSGRRFGVNFYLLCLRLSNFKLFYVLDFINLYMYNHPFNHVLLQRTY